MVPMCDVNPCIIIIIIITTTILHAMCGMTTINSVVMMELW
jgi:hypothetical protein